MVLWCSGLPLLLCSTVVLGYRLLEVSIDDWPTPPPADRPLGPIQTAPAAQQSVQLVQLVDSVPADPPAPPAQCPLAPPPDPANYSQPTEAGVSRRLLAEYEPMAGALVAYMHQNAHGLPWSLPGSAFGVPMALLKEIADRDALYVLVSTQDGADPATQEGGVRAAEADLVRGGVRKDRVHYIAVPLDTWWVRDYGPLWTLVDGEVAVVAHVYDGGQPPKCRLYDSRVPAQVAQALGVRLEMSDVMQALLPLPPSARSSGFLRPAIRHRKCVGPGGHRLGGAGGGGGWLCLHVWPLCLHSRRPLLGAHWPPGPVLGLAEHPRRPNPCACVAKCGYCVGSWC